MGLSQIQGKRHRPEQAACCDAHDSLNVSHLNMGAYRTDKLRHDCRVGPDVSLNLPTICVGRRVDSAAPFEPLRTVCQIGHELERPGIEHRCCGDRRRGWSGWFAIAHYYSLRRPVCCYTVRRKKVLVNRVICERKVSQFSLQPYQLSQTPGTLGDNGT